MRINQRKCIGCRLCVPYCPGLAIKYTSDSKCVVDEDRCFECYACLRSKICSEEAFETTPLEWPRELRHLFSSVVTQHEVSKIAGRGTEEMKTNDVTDRFRVGDVGFTIDVGRPGIGTTLQEVEKIAMAVAKKGVEFEPVNPLTELMVDVKTGKLRDDVKNERVLSCIIEFKVNQNKALEVIRALEDVGKQVSTVFSVGCICRAQADGTIPMKKIFDDEGVFYRPNGKTNIGLGRPSNFSQEVGK